MGPRVTLSRMVLCANRLKDWKTMPTSDRSWASALPSSGRGWPSSRIVPVSMVSRRLIARQSVDLPEPDGPMITTTSPASTDIVMSRSTCSSPKCLFTWRSSTRGVPVAAGGVAGPSPCMASPASSAPVTLTSPCPGPGDDAPLVRLVAIVTNATTSQRFSGESSGSRRSAWRIPRPISARERSPRGPAVEAAGGEIRAPDQRRSGAISTDQGPTVQPLDCILCMPPPSRTVSPAARMLPAAREDRLPLWQ